jgi:ABC-type amino acid transport substrate-binding protein
MFKLTPQSAGYGAAAGAASALLAGSIISSSALSVILFFTAPLPLMLVVFAFGAGAGLVAAAVCATLVAAFVSPAASMIVLGVNLLPAMLAATLVGLARPAEEIGGDKGNLVWFPLGEAIALAALLIAASFVTIGAYAGYSIQFAEEFAREMQAQMQLLNPQFAPTTEFAPSLARFVYSAVPVIQPAMMTLVLAANLWASLRLIRSSGRFGRPVEDWPTSLRLPKSVLVPFAFALACTFLAGPVGLMGSVFAGVLGAGFALAGFAVLHDRSRAWPARPAALLVAYLAVLLLLPVVAIFVFLGLFDTRRVAPVTKA